MDQNEKNMPLTAEQVLLQLCEMTQADPPATANAINNLMDVHLSSSPSSQQYINRQVQPPAAPAPAAMPQPEPEPQPQVIHPVVRRPIMPEPEPEATVPPPQPESPPMPEPVMEAEPSFMLDEEPEEPKPSKKKTKLLWIIIVAVLVLLLLGIGAFFLFGNHEDKVNKPSVVLTPVPTQMAQETFVPQTAQPTKAASIATAVPTQIPTPTPTSVPTSTPTLIPTYTPTPVPTCTPTPIPTYTPTPTPRPTETPVPMATPVTLEGMRRSNSVGESVRASMAGGQKIPVYSGPDYDYIRGANGKAVVSTNDWVECFGYYGDWYLIEYQVKGSQNRRGYINQNDFSRGDRMNETPLPYLNVTATLNAQTKLTDDPANSRNTLTTLSNGKTVTIHFFDGAWVCVSASTKSGEVQGYVPITNVELDPSLNSWLPSQPIGASYVKASTFIDGKGDWSPQCMFDGEETTSWQFKTNALPELSDVYVDIHLDHPTCVTQFWIKNGFWKVTEGYDQYKRNGRLKEVEVSFLLTGSNEFINPVTLTFKDDNKVKDWTKIDLPITRDVEAVRVRVKKVYRGSKFKNDVAVSEMRIAGVDEAMFP